VTTLELILSALSGTLTVGAPVAVAAMRRRAQQEVATARAAVAREASASEALGQTLARLEKVELRTDAISDALEDERRKVNALEKQCAESERRNDECERRSARQEAQIIELRRRVEAREADITQRIELAAERVVQRRTTPPRPFPAVRSSRADMSPAEGERSE
jgi:septal ring factor EnvC (AmiA/AmiB activator)